MPDDSESRNDTLLLQARDKDPYIRQRVAQDPAAPPGALALLADDDDLDVTMALAANPATPGEVLSRLADRTVEDYLASLATEIQNATRRTNLGRAAQEMVLPTRARTCVPNYEGKSPEFWNEAHRKMASYVAYEILEVVASNPNAPAVLLAHLASKDRRRGILRAVAANRSTPAGILAELAAQDDVDLHMAVAANPSTPPATLQKLAGDNWAYVRMQVQGNPNTPEETREALTSSGFIYRR